MTAPNCGCREYLASTLNQPNVIIQNEKKTIEI